jgi:hypothetical protein
VGHVVHKPSLQHLLDLAYALALPMLFAELYAATTNGCCPCVLQHFTAFHLPCEGMAVQHQLP